jgi:hypothetical protein
MMARCAARQAALGLERDPSENLGRIPSRNDDCLLQSLRHALDSDRRTEQAGRKQPGQGRVNKWRPQGFLPPMGTNRVRVPSDAPSFPSRVGLTLCHDST